MSAAKTNAPTDLKKLAKEIQLALNNEGLPIWDIHVHIIENVLKNHKVKNNQL